MKKFLIMISFAIASTFLFAQNLSVPKCEETADHKVKEYSSFTLCYRASYNEPEWVAYEFDKAKSSGKVVERANNFKADKDLNTCLPEDYKVIFGHIVSSLITPYDKGHMSPAKDNAFSEQAMNDCFYMSNMCPQVPNLNRKGWRVLEGESDKWANSFDKVYIVTGPIFTSESKQYIGNKNKVLVPYAFYKIFLACKDGKYISAAFVMDNVDVDINSRDILLQSIEQFQVSIDEVEKMTNIDFYYQLDDNVEKDVESTVINYRIIDKTYLK